MVVSRVTCFPVAAGFEVAAVATAAANRTRPGKLRCMVDLLCGSSAADGTTPPPGLLGTATRSAHPLRRALPPVGLVLAGGQSTRMGRDKTALVARGATLVERAAKKLAATGLQVVIADRGHARLPGWITVSDGPGQGPGAAILGAALAYPERALLVLACDL